MEKELIIKVSEDDLIENINIRNSVANRVEVLGKIKELITYGGTEYVDTELVAEFYEVPKATIETLKRVNKKELELDGVVNLRKSEVEEILNIEGQCLEKYDIPNRGKTLYTKRGMLRVGMLLTKSEVAKEVRTQLLNGFDNSVKNGQVQNFTKDIDEELALNLEFAKAIISGDMNQVLLIQTKINDFKNRKIQEKDNKIDKLENIVDDNVTLDRFNKITNALFKQINKVKYGHDYPDSLNRTIWVDFYNFLYDKEGINVNARQKNKIKKIQEERIKLGKKPLSETTLKGKCSKISTIKESEYKRVIEIAKSFAYKENVDVERILKLV